MGYYTYAYLDTRKPGKFTFNKLTFDFEPIYIGKGCGDRDQYHTKYYCDNEVLRRKFQKIKTLDLTPKIVRLVEHLSESFALSKETEFIKLIGRLNLKKGPLCNMTDGGEGCSGLVQTEDHKRKNSEANSKSYEERYGRETANRLKELRRNQLLGENNPGAKTYKVITRDGEEIITNCLKQFCKENNLTYNVMRNNVNKGKIVRKSVKDTSFNQSETKRKIEGWEIVEIKKDKE